MRTLLAYILVVAFAWVSSTLWLRLIYRVKEGLSGGSYNPAAEYLRGGGAWDSGVGHFLASCTSIAVGFLVFHGIVGRGSFGVGPFLAAIVPHILGDIKAYPTYVRAKIGLESARADLPGLTVAKLRAIYRAGVLGRVLGAVVGAATVIWLGR